MRRSFVKEKRAVKTALFLLGRSVLCVTDVLLLCGIEGKVADGCNDRIDTAGEDTEEKICKGSTGVTFGLECRVVDDDATDPAEEEGKQKSCDLRIHGLILLSYVMPIL